MDGDSLTLAIDCGGSGIKASVVSAAGEMLVERVRLATEYPLSPTRLIETIETIAAQLPAADRITVGMPGMIRGGRVIATPHYVRRDGPFTDIDPEVAAEWGGFDMQGALADRMGMPAMVLNDADVQGFGAISGEGLEVVLTLGTGFGTSWYQDGHVGAHLEISHLPVRKNSTYDEWLGNAARKDIGEEHWTARVLKAIDGLRAMFQWDRCYVGGGNTRHLTVSLPDDVTIVPNSAGITGGARAWEMTRRR
jgi:polyphosphate glucokinase